MRLRFWVGLSVLRCRWPLQIILQLALQWFWDDNMAWIQIPVLVLILAYLIQMPMASPRNMNQEL